MKKTIVRHNDETFLIIVGPSVYTSRNGENDCRICGESGSHGMLHDNGKRYSTHLVLECETGCIIKDYKVLPSILMDPEWLRDNCYLDSLNGPHSERQTT